MEETGSSKMSVEASWNVMSHVKKPDFVFWRKGRVHLNWQGHQFSRLLAAEVCTSAVIMMDTPCSEVVWRVLATHSILPVSPMHHHVPSHFNWSLPTYLPVHMVSQARELYLDIHYQQNLKCYTISSYKISNYCGAKHNWQPGSKHLEGGRGGGEKKKVS